MEEYASAVPKFREQHKRTGTNDTKSGAGHYRWITTNIMNYRKYVEERRTNTGQSTFPIKNMEDIYVDQKKRYNEMGEEVGTSEEEYIEAITRPSCRTRVIWGITEKMPHATTGHWDHWFGEMKHYEHWLGNPDSAAIYIRMDHAVPEGPHQITLSALRNIFDDNNFDVYGLISVMEAALDSLSARNLYSLQALASFYSQYQTSSQSSIDVRVLERPLTQSHWFLSLQDSDPIWSDTGLLTNENEDDRSDVSPLSSDEVGFFAEVMEQMTEIQDEPMPQTKQSIEQSIPKGHSIQGHKIGYLLDLTMPKEMSIAQSFSCALLFENSYDISPKQLKNVIAMSSGNSLFIDASLLCDPISPPKRAKIQHVVGNVGKPGIALLVPPMEPNIMTLGIKRWHLINFNAWDGQTRDSFTDSSLHIWFTGFTQALDIGHSGGQDKELYILESVVALHAKGEWIADLDIMKCAESLSLIHRHVQISPTTWLTLKNGEPQAARSTNSFICGEDDHASDYQQQKGQLAAVENWNELLTDTEKNCIFLAKGNWQARLAAMMICVRMKRRVCLLPNDFCWDCVNLLMNVTHHLDDPIVYIH